MTTAKKKVAKKAAEPAWQQRVRVEREELEEKLGRLKVFMKAPQFLAIDKEEQRLMFRQVGLMEQYSNVLGVRLDLFGRKKTPTG